MTEQDLPSGDEAWTEDREGGDGAEAGGASVLDVASGCGLHPAPCPLLVLFRGVLVLALWIAA